MISKIKILLSVFVLLVHMGHLKGSQLHEYTVPGNYNNIVQAINQGVNNNANVVNGDEIIITVLEGNISHGALLANIAKSVKITVVGAGADKTIIVPANTPRRLANLQASAADNIELIFRNLTFRDWGFIDGDLPGGVFNITKSGIKVKFENVVFENNSASRGGVMRASGSDQLITFHNCYFGDNKTLERISRPDGQLFKEGTGELNIIESTFYNNQSDPVDLDGVDPGLTRGSVLDIVTNESQQLNVTLEKNTIVNNRFVPNASEASIQPAISIRTNEDSSIFLKITDNMVIENRRGGNNNDIDFYFTNPDQVILNAKGNIANRLMAMQNDENVAFAPNGFTINPLFSFDHPLIDYAMDGDDPQGFIDEFGVPYFIYHGTGMLPAVLVEEISLSAVSTLVEVGSTMQIVATILPEEADDKTVTWSVDDIDVATVDDNGLLTAVSTGTVTVTATANDSSGVTGTLGVEVFAAAPVLVSSITLSAPASTVQVGETLQISAEVLPEEAEEKSVTWSVGDANVATIDANGLLTAVSIGAVTITAAANDESGVKGVMTIEVIPVPPVLVSSITLSAPASTVQVGETLQISAEVLPEEAEEKSVTWGVDNTAVATIDANGLLTAVAEGTAMVTATANDASGVSGALDITVDPAPPVMVSVIILSASADSLEIGQTIEITATILPEDAGNKTLVWSVSDEGIAAVSESGMLTGVSMGEVVVTATATDGSEISGEINIQIIDSETYTAKLDLPTMRIYPNPSSGVFYITIPGNSLQAEYHVFNIIGTRIDSGIVYGDFHIDLTSMQRGIYLLKINTENPEILKLVLQ